MKEYKNSFLCLVIALIWGCAFVAQSVGMEYIGPFTFTAARFFIGSAVLLPVILLVPAQPAGDEAPVQPKSWFLRAGILCGAVIFLSQSIQQVGIQYTSVGKAGFISSTYMILVPLFSWVFFRQKVPPKLWASIAIAIAGMYFLCMSESFHINLGDLLILLCSVVIALHTLLVSRFVLYCDSRKLACLQFFVGGCISLAAAFLFEEPSWQGVLACAVPLLYLGVLSSGLATTLQMLVLRETDPTVVSLLTSLQSVFSVLAGWLILGQGFSQRELFGCVLVFAAVILVQLPSRKKNPQEVKAPAVATGSGRDQ